MEKVLCINFVLFVLLKHTLSKIQASLQKEYVCTSLVIEHGLQKGSDGVTHLQSVNSP